MAGAAGAGADAATVRGAELPDAMPFSSAAVKAFIPPGNWLINQLR